MEHQHETHELHHKQREQNPYMLPGSILLSGVIIAATILYNNNAVVKTLENISIPAAQVQGTQGAAAPAPAPAQDTTPQIVEVNPRGDQPVMGNKSAKVTIIEFADFQCPYCQRFFQDTFGQIKKDYVDTGKVKYVFRHYPLTQIHVNAQISSVAAECANQQGKFWEYHDLLYVDGKADGAGLASADLKKYADQLGLNKGMLGFGKNKFNQCLDKNDTLQAVQADQKTGTDIGVSGTPSFLIIKGDSAKVDANAIRNSRQNVTMLDGGNAMVVGAVPYATLKPVIDQLLQ